MNTTTNIRDQKIETINELIAITRDSAEFYDDAAGKARNPKLQTLFTDMAASKNGLVGAMSREVQVEGAKPEVSGTFLGTLHQLYGDVRSKLDSDDFGYVAELEASEDRMLSAFNEVLKDDDVPMKIKDAVRSYLPKVREHHDLMRDRKWAMEATKH